MNLCKTVKPILLFVILICVCQISVDSLNAQVSISSGSWTSPDSWEGGIVPGEGSSATILHNIVIDTDTSIGVSGPSGSTAILVQPEGNLTVATDQSLRVTGDIVLNDSRLDMDPGSLIEFDSSLADSPATTMYSIQVGTADFQTNSQLNINCTPENRCQIRSNNANNFAQGFITSGPYFGSGSIAGSYVDFIRLGDADIPALSTSVGEGNSFTLEQASFVDGGMLQTAHQIPDGSDFSLKNTTWKNTQADQSAILNFFDVLTSGVREVSGCIFDREVRFYPPSGMTIKNNFFNEAFDVTNAPWESFNGNFIRKTHQPSTRIAASSENNYWFVDNPAVENPHFIQALSYSRDMSITRDIFELNSADEDGDCILISLPDEPVTAYMRGNIVLPNSIGSSSCTLFSALGSENTTLIAEHNTYIMGSQGAAVGETYAGHTDMLMSFRSNLAWDTMPRGYKLYDSPPDDEVLDLVRSENADFNGGFNFLEGSNGNGYHNLEFSSGTPGSNDVEGDPQFLDSARNLAAWDAHLGGPGTVENALTELRKKNDPSGYNPNYNLPNLRNYIRQGFYPQNPLFSNAAHDGSHIGAIQSLEGEPIPDSVLPAPEVILRPRWRNVRTGRAMARVRCLVPEDQAVQSYEFNINRRRTRTRNVSRPNIRVRVANAERLQRLSVTCRYFTPEGSSSQLSAEQRVGPRQIRRLLIRQRTQMGR